jgi:hypothetical protein
VAESIPTFSHDPTDLAVATVGRDLRVVTASTDDDACTLEVITYQKRAGRRSIGSRYQLGVTNAHGLRAQWIHLTTDGRYLAARDSWQFCLFELFEDHATLIYAKDDKLDTSVAMGGKKLLDVSFDGRFAAYGAERRIRVVGIPGGESVAEVIQEPDSFALSPDGRLLAVVDQRRKAILFYGIPQGKVR